MTTLSNPKTAISDTRFAKLARGINLSHWFAQDYTNQYSLEHLRTYNTEADIALLAKLGCSHLRFTLNPVVLLNESNPTELNPSYLAEVDRVIDLMLAHDLAVIVDLNPEDDFKQRLFSSPSLVKIFASFWQRLAAHLAQRDPEMLFLEVLNEPVVTDAQQWAFVQAELLAAMRAGAPNHTLIATGHKWSSITELLELEPLADPNIIYNFHCYDPHTFTHQAATWGAPYWPYLEYLPYPSSPEALAPIVATIDDDVARDAAINYGNERWNIDTLREWIGQAAAWAEQHQVRLTCNEFGVYRFKSKPEDRAAWLHDLRSVLEEFNIGWTMWDYAGGFSVVNQLSGQREIDALTVEALGLQQ